PNDGFQIEQYAPGTGHLVALANAGVYLEEMSGAVNVLDVESQQTGDVDLTVHDSVLAGEDLNLLQSGTQTFVENYFNTLLSTYGRILAPNGSVVAAAGDNFNLPTGTVIQAGTATGDTVKIVGGQMIGAQSDPDPVGSILEIAGTITASSVEID